MLRKRGGVAWELGEALNVEGLKDTWSSTMVEDLALY